MIFKGKSAFEKSELQKNIKRERISIVVIALITVFFIVASLFFLNAYLMNMQETVLDTASAYIGESVSAASQSSSKFFENRLIVLTRAAAYFDGLPEEEIVPTLSRYCDERIFARIAFVKTDGTAIVSDGSELSVQHRLFAQEIFNGDARILPSSESGAERDLYAVPVKDSDGNVLGALVGGSEPASLLNINYRDSSSILNGYSVINEDGRVLFTDDDPVFTANDNIFTLLSNAGNDINELKTACSRRNVSGNLRMTLGGKDYLISYNSMSLQNWTVILTTPVDSILSFAVPMLAPSILLIVTTIMIFLALAAYAIFSAHRAQKVANQALLDSHKHFYEDNVTGFNSWQKFIEDYNEKMIGSSTNCALLSLDVDKFKEVNDTVGFEGGNDILKKLAKIISRNLGANDLFARSSADRFYLLVDYREKDDLIDLVNRLISDIDYQITIMRIIVSIGIYLIVDRTVSVHTAADRADIARSSVKTHKESIYRFFESSMLENIRQEHFIETIMDTALERREFLVYLQPKVSLDDVNLVTGAEALVRWKHDGKIIPPGQFIPLFERNGFVTKLDFYMFREVCRIQRKWQSMGRELKLISVNMSRAHLRNPDFVQTLVDYCKEFEIDPKYFEIEITESAAFENIDILMTVFTQIKEAGFHVSIDDFGTGYSSLNMLKDLPVDVLKIDRSFLTEEASETENASKIIGSVVSLATALDISTICEGIETKEQASLLTKLGCDMAQGFFFAKPMPIDDFEKLVYPIEAQSKDA
ncbi:MAG: EAL domain-containing protein [Bacteroides sp.]|nr:EAL domain-containing protein [Eubacterium sp.]MCM1418603.1 EAL domain-containing protein [Roseburia sp.]MCM1462657.1 EAL domain-containing protein [Bacteroides sp.]